MGEGVTVSTSGSTIRLFLKPAITRMPLISEIPQEIKKTQLYPQLSTIKPLGRAPRLLEAARIAVKMAMKVAFFNGGALAATYPRPGPQMVERITPHKKKMVKMMGTS